MKPKPTPGPWIVVPTSRIYRILGPTREEVAQVVTQVSDGDALSNATLISAAPEMLKMLESLLADICDADREEDQILIDRLDALIQKARG